MTENPTDYQCIGNSYESVCCIGNSGSGVLIGSQWVLTAAHVVDQGAWEIMFGSDSDNVSPENVY